MSTIRSVVLLANQSLLLHSNLRSTRLIANHLDSDSPRTHYLTCERLLNQQGDTAQLRGGVGGVVDEQLLKKIHYLLNYVNVRSRTWIISSRASTTARKEP